MNERMRIYRRKGVRGIGRELERGILVLGVARITEPHHKLSEPVPVGNQGQIPGILVPKAFPTPPPSPVTFQRRV